MVEVGLPFVGMAEVEGHEAEHGEQGVSALEVDHVGGEGLGDLGQRRLHGEHVFEGREMDVEALGTGAGLGQTKLAGAVAKMVRTVFLVFGSHRVASAAGVVEVSACVGHECSGRGEWRSITQTPARNEEVSEGTSSFESKRCQEGGM